MALDSYSSRSCSSRTSRCCLFRRVIRSPEGSDIRTFRGLGLKDPLSDVIDCPAWDIMDFFCDEPELPVDIFTDKGIESRLLPTNASEEGGCKETSGTVKTFNGSRNLE